MDHGTISRAGVARALQSEGSPLSCVIAEGLDPDQLALRQLYLDAIHIPAAIMARDGATTVSLARNRSFERIISGPWMADTRPLDEAVLAFLAAGKQKHVGDWHQPGVGGRHYRVHLSRLPSAGVFPEQAMLSLVDRTAEIETARSLRAEMQLDSLTGLPNRLAFNEAVADAVDEDGAVDGFAVLAVDLVRFSRVNECVGSLAGDELIVTVAHRLMQVLRPGDLLARMAGDEFGVLIRLVDGPGDALHAARRLQAELASPIRLSDLEIRIDCAIGCALWSDRAPTSADMLRNAQVALKRAKTSGRIEVYQSGEVNLIHRRFSLETDLRRAIENDELSMAFQPLVDLETNAVSGFEALARWTHPDHGPIPPTEFIAVAEDSRLIVPLGRWALDAAVRTLADWDRRSGEALPIRMCVNMSPVQIARDDIGEAVVSTLSARGIDGRRLTLELTERSIVVDPERASRVLRMMHEIGCCVAMDDFGTGYSSLAYLQRLPIDILKIDRSFVTDMLENRNSVAIIRAILSLARELGMATTAEGIETVEAARTLAALGCTTGQGYHFARPLAADAALDYFCRNRAA
ncbi:putative bifunctional diguanylate cyclase/phosphodiesterase [Sphingomonas sp. MMS24-J13]|uniref:putative bifunctional diguanylate cyclase/phosphodiesterase n=1 Tax=Sphingomonas sp. MMS24-J13 TaxID=3238686 RepID=UPI0038504974